MLHWVQMYAVKLLYNSGQLDRSYQEETAVIQQIQNPPGGKKHKIHRQFTNGTWKYTDTLLNYT